MEDLKAVAWMMRYGVRSLVHNLEQIPEEWAAWKPAPESKSPLEIAQEVIRAIQMFRGILDGPEAAKVRPNFAQPATLADARRDLLMVADEYATALEQAGEELDRPQAMPFGGVFRAYRAVCFPLMDLFHHHGQICYLQSLLGDDEMHWNADAIDQEFAWKGDPNAESSPVS
jgi:hypothetical protein